MFPAVPLTEVSLYYFNILFNAAVSTGTTLRHRQVKKVMQSSSQIWKCEEKGQKWKRSGRDTDWVRNGVLKAHNTATQVLQLVICICNSVGEMWGMQRGPHKSRRTGEVLKNALAFGFTFILQKVNQYLLTPVHSCHMAFGYEVTRAWTWLSWTENSSIHRDFSTECLKHGITSHQEKMGLNLVLYCTTVESVDRNH